ncbi:triple QxxK/R motif-containing protein isoform X2 [Panthera uncia]|uniref:triple QxxK/R motif-containing protein isoform X2 n=1 Tax=Panthera uncia TaxID=29064 RepID=UPI0020FFE77A|nr:triple QxxK/R motif-containing protein isoform X2 [Panthera uncia]
MKCNIVSTQRERRFGRYAFWRSKMGRKDASTVKLPVDQYRKQIGKQDYKKTKPILRATKLKAEAKKTAIGIKITVLDNQGRKIIRPYQICSLLVSCQHCAIGPEPQANLDLPCSYVGYQWTGRICYHFVPVCRQTWKGAFSDVKRLMPTMQVKVGKDLIFLNKINVLLPGVIDLNLQARFKLKTPSEQSINPIHTSTWSTSV